ncbi:hypothetical protein Pst134EA_019211 [Puccinia striiformis f. sp. tritici]|uniref:hypothetical protein n=1 Tax=Puccinia striiformis f. sp. tritici TaxID=168172 RepID=UPI0020084D3E|nr:hypothetical protein Pst134EA_019211 [Puccinia striiformis f. sp. tritici]KAH9459060.1 hypothetical protein Pst134EA_019211 [Puccinia striiformis f. sp. tritici]
MVAETEYYDRLGVAPDVDEAALKKAYLQKRFALQLHPDKNPAGAEEFKAVSEAYDVLSTPEKRELYDQCSKRRPKAEIEWVEWTQETYFPAVRWRWRYGSLQIKENPPYKRRSTFLNHPSGFPSSVVASPTDLERTRSPTSNQSFTRRTLHRLNNKIALQKHVLESKQSIDKWGRWFQQPQQTCQEYQGIGEIINPKDRCKDCTGAKIVKERKVLDVHIDKGMRDGQIITFRGEADQSPNVTPGDVEIIIEEKPHPIFKRKEDDLVAEIEVDLVTALTGGVIPLEHLDSHATDDQSQSWGGSQAKMPPNSYMASACLPFATTTPVTYSEHQNHLPDSIPPESCAALQTLLPPPRPLPTWGDNI